jgi:hypothetical protein
VSKSLDRSTIDDIGFVLTPAEKKRGQTSFKAFADREQPRFMGMKRR